MKTAKPWWKGSRGEWYVVLQAALLLLVALGPQTWEGLERWESVPWLWQTAGLIFFVAGICLAAAGAGALGRNLTPLPRPKEEGTFVETGPYRLVRHPIYSGIIFAAFGWSLWNRSWLTTTYSVLLCFFFDLKSRREELWLKEKFPGYARYQKAVRKLIPFIY